MRKFGHITPRYVFYRLMDIWYQKRHPDHPWITPQAIHILQSWLTSADKGIEWGSGKSTLWFARRTERLVSIEHDPAWYEKTSILLKRRGLADKVDYHLLPLTDEKTVPTPPDRSTKRNLYAEAVNDYPDKSFDFALVDGKIRHVCMNRVLPKLRAGGMLILDNAERYVPGDAAGAYFAKGNYKNEASVEWEDLLARLKQWRTIMTTNGVWCTRFWIKPCQSERAFCGNTRHL